MKQQVKIVLADDNEIFRDGISSLLRKQKWIDLAGEADNGSELLQLVGKHKPQVVITDIKMPGTDGIAAAKELQKNFPNTAILALSMYDEEEMIIEMLEAGAKGYLLKNAHKEEIFEAIQSVMEGKFYYCNETTRNLARRIAKSNIPHLTAQQVNLSEKEKMIIQLMCEQNSSKEISEKLFLSLRTIESYRKNIMEKIGSRNLAGVVIYAIKSGLYQVK